MTTICYKNNIIAYDSRMMKGTVILSDNYDKMVDVNGIYFFFCGSTCDFDDFIDSYFGKKIDRLLDCQAFVYDHGNLFSVTFDNEEKEVLKSPLPLDIPDAIGSGSHFALMAMDLGSSAEGAIRLASKRDAFTNDNVKIFKLDDIKEKENGE